MQVIHIICFIYKLYNCSSYLLFNFKAYVNQLKLIFKTSYKIISYEIIASSYDQLKIK